MAKVLQGLSLLGSSALVGYSMFGVSKGGLLVLNGNGNALDERADVRRVLGISHLNPRIILSSFLTLSMASVVSLLTVFITSLFLYREDAGAVNVAGFFLQTTDSQV